MANGEKILVVGRHMDILIKVVRLLEQHGYSPIGKQWNEEAIEAFKKEKIDAVVIGGGVDNESRQLFHTEFKRLNPLVKIIDGHPRTILVDLQNAFGK